MNAVAIASIDRMTRTSRRESVQTRPLDARERQAVMVGRADAFRPGWDRSLAASGARGWLGGLIARLAGARRVTAFADERLEALRLFACMMRRDDRRIDAQAARLIEAGYSQAALHQAIALALA